MTSTIRHKAEPRHIKVSFRDDMPEDVENALWAQVFERLDIEQD
jgi:hypothetical protein